MDNICILATTCKNFTIIKDSLTLMFSFIALIISFITLWSNLKEKRQKRLPNLKILSIINTKSILNASDITQSNHCRIQHGYSTCNISLDGKICTYKSEDCKEYGYIDEIKANKNKAYFTYFSSKPHLVINHATDNNRFIIDHSNVKIIFHNYGAKISALSISKFKIFFNDNTHFESLVLLGDKNNKLTISPQENETFELYFDEITTDLNNSMCQLVNPEYYDSSPQSIDLLKTHIPKEIFAYNKIEMTTTCWDVNNRPIEYLITIEHNGNFFLSSTTLLSKFWI